jgi:hypothetical protein
MPEFLQTNGVIPDTIIFPDPLVQGDQWNLQMFSGKWGQSGYSAVIYFAAGSTKMTAPAVLSDSMYVWSIPGTSTAQLAPQPYQYNVNVIDPAGNRQTIEQGVIEVAPDISSSGNRNIQAMSNLELMLQACDNTIIQLLSQKTTMVQFAGQMYQMHDIEKLYAVRSNLAIRVADERDAARGNKRARRIITVFKNI